MKPADALSSNVEKINFLAASNQPPCHVFQAFGRGLPVTGLCGTASKVSCHSIKGYLRSERNNGQPGKWSLSWNVGRMRVLRPPHRAASHELAL
ncbi:hypothetical protein BX600DRAFT_475551 [Xylariales sp. PMI_506]|nr:hypothetical protein BX600DRAFT_475551 [Xylariales sp. PMI_506]